MTLFFDPYLLVFLIFARLIGNTAACFAGRLARCLAFAASAVFSAFAKVACFKRFYVLHLHNLQYIFLGIISRLKYIVNLVFPPYSSRAAFFR